MAKIGTERRNRDMAANKDGKEKWAPQNTDKDKDRREAKGNRKKGDNSPQKKQESPS